MPGTLFVVATPIGNLEDLTFRALRTLREVDLIAAEDTRRTARLLAHYEIRRPMVSLREHNEVRETPRLLDRLAAGESLALVSDAGTPTISDPGARLVRATLERGLTVVPIPGPSAIVTALSVSGMSGDQFVFLGFPPAAGSRRRAWMENLAKEPRVVVFFEAPHRIRRTVDEVATKCGKRPIFVARELSKKFETLVIRYNNDSLPILEAGEFTVVLGQTEKEENSGDSPGIDSGGVFDMFCRLTNITCFQQDEAIAIVSKSFGIGGDAVRKIVKKAKILVNQQNRSPS